MNTTLIKNNKTLILLFILAIFVLCLSFFVMIQTQTKTLAEFQGEHTWLSASTVKFVNNYFKDGVIKDHFLMLEAPDSIEFDKIEEREAYVSYPPMSSLIPYTVAKLTGQNEITSYWLITFEKILYLINNILIFSLVYLVIRYLLNFKKNKWNILISTMLAMFWMMLPNNIYYLTNVYFADQLILTFVFAFFTLELLQLFVLKTNISRTIIQGILAILTLLAVLTDYYFWIVLACVFLYQLLIEWKITTHTFASYVKAIVTKTAHYTIPAVLGVILFVIQLISVPNGFHMLFAKLGERSGSGQSVIDLITKVKDHMLAAYSHVGILILIIGISVLSILTIKALYDYFKKDNKSNFTTIGFIAVMIGSACIQIMLLSNHSSIHEFSILKLGLPLILCLLLIVTALFKLFANNVNYVVCKISIFAFFTIAITLSFSYLGNLSSLRKEFYQIRSNNNKVSYLLEQELRNSATYQDVYLSYTYEILNNPPQSLAISGKRVYRVEDVESYLMKEENAQANYHVVIQNNIEKTKEILNKEQIIKDKSSSVTKVGEYEIYHLKKERIT